MKCKGCGANYKTRELRCPYCHTENIIGKMWKVERTEAEKEYERTREAIGKSISPYVIDRVLTRSIIVVILIFILIFAGANVFSYCHEKLIDYRNDSNRDEITKTLEGYYEAEEYAEMYEYMSDKEIPGQEYYPYMQSALMYNDYQQYMGYRTQFQHLTDEEKWEDDYYIKYAISYSVEVYMLNCGIYSELDSMNQELWDKYQREIMAYWIGELQLTEEEIAYLLDEDTSLYGDDFDELLADIKERIIGEAHGK